MLTEVHTLADGWTTKCMVKENFAGLINESSLANMFMTKNKGMVYSFGQITINMKDHGQTVDNMVLDI